jgi:hypothetical protein
VIPTSAWRAGAPVPSMTRPFSIRTSYINEIGL